MNKDEAERCIELGMQAMKKGDKDKAIRLFQKSLNLHPSEVAKKWLKAVAEMPQTHVNKDPEPAPEPHKPAAPKFTADQEKICREILGKNDYYDILGIAKTASTDDIKKAYRKLALRLHPDKNHAPSASEAFKKINKSFACLSDEMKRRTYDQTGQEEIHGIEMNHYNAGEADFAEHVFREFFGESFFFPQQGFHRVYRTGNRGRNMNHQYENQQQNNMNRAPLLQFLPIIIVIFLSLASNFTSSSELFSFHQTHAYSVRKVTENLNIEYYIQPSYAKDLSYTEKTSLEKSVEVTYMNYMYQECEMQKRKKNTLLSKANYYKGNTGKQYREYAENVDMTSCTTWQDLHERGKKN